MADAQTPVLTDEQILDIAVAQGINHKCVDAKYAAALALEQGTRYCADDVSPETTVSFARAVLAAQAPAQPVEPAWDRFIERLNAVQPLDKLTKHGHKNLLGSVAHYKAIFLAANADQSPAPSHPERAVMQQALDALQTLHSMQSEWHADFPEHVGDKEAPAMQAARAAIAALSATMEKPHGN